MHNEWMIQQKAYSITTAHISNTTNMESGTSKAIFAGLYISK